MKLRQAVACVGWRSRNEEELQQDSEAPPGSGRKERSVQTRMERSGRSLKEDNSTPWVSFLELQISCSSFGESIFTFYVDVKVQS